MCFFSDRPSKSFNGTDLRYEPWLCSWLWLTDALSSSDYTAEVPKLWGPPLRGTVGPLGGGEIFGRHICFVQNMLLIAWYWYWYRFRTINITFCSRLKLEKYVIHLLNFMSSLFTWIIRVEGTWRSWNTSNREQSAWYKSLGTSVITSRKIGWLINEELERTWKESVVAYFRIVFLCTCV
jgi:hypothetical protein